MKLSETPELHGIWERPGYGDIYVVGKKRVKLYQYTRATCFLAERFKRNEFADLLVDIELHDGGNTLSATDPDEPAFRHHYVRRDALPSTCDAQQRLQGFVPTQVFDHVWHTFNDYYAFFDERGVDWRSTYALRSQIDDSISKKALFAHLRTLLSPIDDGHVGLESRFGEYYPELERGSEAILRSAFERQQRFNRFRDYEDWVSERYESVLERYLDPGSVHRAGGPRGDVLMWGTIGRRIGYLRIDGMTGISADRDYSSLDDVAAVRVIMQRIVRQLQTTNAMIVDVRFNGGGDDAVGLAIASFFADKRTRAITKVARDYRGDSPVREAYLEPSSTGAYLKPTAVIAGQDTASAAEVFVMAMRALPQITHVGEATNGVLSDELYKSLPKGWEFTLSNEVYFDHTGKNYEATGVPAQIVVSTLDPGELEAGRNGAIDRAIEHLQ